MKKILLALILLVVIFSMGCSKRVESIEGEYTYNADFSTKKMFKDVAKVDNGDTSFVSGEITIKWKTKDEVKGNMITVESTFGEDSTWSNAKGFDVQTSGNYPEKIKEAGIYSYKLTLDNTPMHTYRMTIPSFSIMSPLPIDMTLTGKDFTIEFNKIETAEKYMVFILNYNGDSIWAVETADTMVKYAGLPLEFGMIYSVTVSSVLVCDSINTINVSATNQFVIKKAE